MDCGDSLDMLALCISVDCVFNGGKLTIWFRLFQMRWFEVFHWTGWYGICQLTRYFVCLWCFSGLVVSAWVVFKFSM